MSEAVALSPKTSKGARSFGISLLRCSEKRTQSASNKARPVNDAQGINARNSGKDANDRTASAHAFCAERRSGTNSSLPAR
jgi:hypothetical protein